MDAAHQHQASLAIDQMLLENIGTTSLTSVLVDNEFNSNFAHAFYYGSTVIPAGKKHLHGKL